jgi:hypothetical protein
MIIKYYSKLSNYRLRLTPSVPGNPYLQIPEVRGKSVHFSAGAFETGDTELIELLEKSPRFNVEFFRVDEDPYAKQRARIEPVHDIQELEAGRPVKTVSSATPKQMEDMKAEMLEMAKTLAKEMVKEAFAAQAKEDAEKVSAPVVEPVIPPAITKAPVDTTVDTENPLAGPDETLKPAPTKNGKK